MWRNFRIVVLTLGVVAGFGFAIHASQHRHEHREAFERHVAQICVDAARGANVEH